ncbi:MAG: ComF family protein [bacterium]
MSCEKYTIVVAKYQASGYNPVMSNLFGQLVDLVFPPCCAICKKKDQKIICDDCLGRIVRLKPPICRICGKPKDNYFVSDLCEDCNKENIPFAVARSVALYEGTLKEAIHKFKFNGKKALSILLGRLLVSYLKHGDIPMREIDLIIPLPLSKKRENQRGYNQSRLLAEEIASHYSIDLDVSSLKKIKDVAPQFELSRKERFGNIKGAFSSSPLTGKNVLLIDDIYTTGATICEASRSLKGSGVKNVYVLTLARAVED